MSDKHVTNAVVLHIKNNGPTTALRLLRDCVFDVTNSGCVTKATINRVLTNNERSLFVKDSNIPPVWSLVCSGDDNSWRSGNDGGIVPYSKTIGDIPRDKSREIEVFHNLPAAMSKLRVVNTVNSAGLPEMNFCNNQFALMQHLQEITGRSMTPEYKMYDRGLDHLKEYLAVVVWSGINYTGQWQTTKRKARESAAGVVLDDLDLPCTSGSNADLQDLYESVCSSSHQLDKDVFDLISMMAKRIIS